MLAVQKRVMESTKNSSGLFSRFKGWGSGKSAVSINDVWHKLALHSAIVNYRNLTNEISGLKKREETK